MSVSTVAGTGSSSTRSDGYGTNAGFRAVAGISADLAGNVYITEYLGHTIRKISSSGYVSTFAGSGSNAFSNGIGTTARFNYPHGVAVDTANNIFVADSYNNRIRSLTVNAVVSVLAGSSSGVADGVGTSATFFQPSGIAIDSNGVKYVTDTLNNKVRKINTNGVVTSIAGGVQGLTDGLGTAARFYGPIGVAVSSNGNLFISDTSNAAIRKISTANVVTTLVIQISPNHLNLDTSGMIYVASTYNQKIFRVDPSSGAILLVAGSGTQGLADGMGTAATFGNPSGIDVDSNGLIYIADYNWGLIRTIKVSSEFFLRLSVLV